MKVVCGKLVCAALTP
ncbi:hypothetical protein NB574_20935 [Vibrio vulnificus]|nr:MULTISPECIES: hypothetical protein [Vibrio]MCF8781120.1 hypothetical protein [Vibrio floridensis]MCG6272312.1 hypothetical protein [Vibrio vulnificus]MCG6291189.1 hypothetical protein [Vibrio vulnificus]MCJ0812030.1 hypothetical protein [Vibrio vulnificus]MCJ0824342.1 hypothetical protein [Vibrio vulnificus]